MPQMDWIKSSRFRIFDLQYGNGYLVYFVIQLLSETDK